MSPTIHEVVITFRVHAPNATARDRVWLLGSLPELGEYNPARAIETGQVAEEWKVWQATVRMPVESAFQWGWCTMTVDGRLRRWESMSGRRERQISCYSGTLHTEYGDTGLEIFEQNMASAEITTEKRTKRGDVLAVLGSSIPLGAWDPHRAVIAREFPRRSGCWSATIFYDGGTLQEWNWIIIEEKNKEVKLMEKHATRFLHDTHGWIKIHVPWNKKEAIVDWKNKDYTGGGDTYVGTVDLIKARRIRLMEIRRWEETAEYRRQGRPVGCLLHSPTAMHQSPTPTPSPPSSKGSASPPKSTTPTESVAVALHPTPHECAGKTPRPAALKPAPAVTKAETGEGSVSSLEFGERSEDVMRNPEEKSSATGCPKAAAQSFADFKPLLRIKPYGDESGGRQQQRSVSPDRAAGKIQTKTIKAAQTAVEERGSISSRGSKAKCFPPLGDLFKRSSKGSTEQLVPEKTAEKPGRPTTKDAGKANVDMAALGFKGDKPADGDKKKCLVSEPGKPGYPRKSSEEMSGRTSESRDRPVAQAKSRAPDSPPQISPSQGVENYMCHTVQGREVWARGSSEFIPVGPSSSWGSTVGILYDPDKPRPAGSSRLAKLQKMTEQREQARAVERMEGIRQREERNRNKFHLDQKFVLATAEAYPRSPPGGSPTRGANRKSQETDNESEEPATKPKQ